MNVNISSKEKIAYAFRRLPRVGFPSLVTEKEFSYLSSILVCIPSL